MTGSLSGSLQMVGNNSNNANKTTKKRQVPPLSLSLSLSVMFYATSVLQKFFSSKNLIVEFDFCAAVTGRLGHCTNARQTMNRSCPSSQMSSSQMVSPYCQIINIVNSGIKCCSLWSKDFVLKNNFYICFRWD